MRNMNILARNALKEVTKDPLYSVSVRLDYDRPWIYVFSLAYKNVILYEKILEIEERKPEAIQEQFLINIKYVLEEEDFTEWIDFITKFNSTMLPDYYNDNSEIYWNGLEYVIHAPDLASAEKAYEEMTGKKVEVNRYEDGIYYV